MQPTGVCCEESDTCAADCCNSAQCDDSDICNGIEVCQDGECQPGEPMEAPVADPSSVPKARFISFVTPYTGVSAIRVKLVELYHPSEPPPRAEDFGPFEGQYRWLNSFKDTQGQPIFVCAGKGAPHNYTFRCATLGCEPEYRDWAAELQVAVNPSPDAPDTPGLVHVTGSAIVPSSQYEVQLQVANSTCGQPGFEWYTPPLLLETTFWGDITSASFGPPDNIADVLDLPAVSNYLKDLGPILAEQRVWQKNDDPLPHLDAITVIDLGHVVDSGPLGRNYFKNMCACPPPLCEPCTTVLNCEAGRKCQGGQCVDLCNKCTP